MRAFGEMLKSQRLKLGLTQKQIADSAGVTDAYICSLERDKRIPPPYYTVAAISDALQLDAEKLWKVAVKYREKQVVEKSRRKSVSRGKNSKINSDSLRQESTIEVPDSHIDAFFDRPEIQMTTFGIFQKQPKEMTMEEKRTVYQAIESVRGSILKRKEGDQADSSSGLTD